MDMHVRKARSSEVGTWSTVSIWRESLSRWRTNKHTTRDLPGILARARRQGYGLQTEGSLTLHQVASSSASGSLICALETMASIAMLFSAETIARSLKPSVAYIRCAASMYRLQD